VQWCLPGPPLLFARNLASASRENLGPFFLEPRLRYDWLMLSPGKGGPFHVELDFFAFRFLTVCPSVAGGLLRPWDWTCPPASRSGSAHNCFFQALKGSGKGLHEPRDGAPASARLLANNTRPLTLSSAPKGSDRTRILPDQKVRRGPQKKERERLGAKCVGRGSFHRTRAHVQPMCL